MSLEHDITVLRGLDFFSEFNDEQLRLVAFGCQKMKFPENTELFHAGQTSDGGYVILDGEIALTIPVANGEPKTTRMGKGNLIGEMALLTRNQRVGTATVLSACEVIKIRRDVIYRIFEEYPELAASLHKKISANIVNIGRELEKVQRQLPPETV